MTEHERDHLRVPRIGPRRRRRAAAACRSAAQGHDHPARPRAGRDDAAAGGDRHTHTREFLEAQIAILMGGRVAEELFLRQMTSGAGNDIERATEIARRMVCEFGMSSLGPLAYRTPGNPWETDRGAGISEATAQRVDEEVRELVMRGYETARQIVAKNRAAVARWRKSCSRSSRSTPTASRRSWRRRRNRA